MIGRVGRVSALMLVVVAGLTACGSSDRPRGLSIDGVKPCSLIPPAELGSLGVTAKPQSLDVVAGAGEEGASCSYTPRSGETVDVSTVTNQGIGHWTSDTGDHAVTEMPRIMGYRTIKVAIRSFPGGPHESCSMYVDVASGESLRVEVGENSDNDPPTCDTAHRFGEAAMKTLTTRS